MTARRATTVDFDQAKLDPGSVFTSPEEVADHAGLSTDQKIEILRRWEYDAAEVAVAVEEGMPDGESDLLRQIVLALDRLSDGIDVEEVGPTKQHGLPDPSRKLK
jgi:hypothetical protein